MLQTVSIFTISFMLLMNDAIPNMNEEKECKKGNLGACSKLSN